MSNEKPSEVLLYIARHGTTELNQEGCYRGPLNPDLDGRGWHDANQLAFWFEPIELSGIFYSDKTRSRHTAEKVKKGRHPDTVFVSHHNLRALNVGDLGGQEKTPETEAIVRHHVNNPDLPFKGGESLNEFRARVRPLLINGLELALKSTKPVLIVAHSSIVHEAGQLFNGDHKSSLVLPGGVAAVYASDGKLKSEPIFKPDLEKMGKGRSEVIT